MKKAYKYKANAIIGGEKRDTVQLFQNVFYAANLRILNDPFEGSAELPEHAAIPIVQALYTVGIYSLSKPEVNETFPANELLWAHYANSHKGFCIEYDLEVLASYLSRDFVFTNLL